MKRWSKTLVFFTLAAFFLAAAGSVSAQQKEHPGGQPETPYEKPYPVGQVEIKLTEIGAGVGLEWGTGVLTYKGKQYTFKIKGLKAATVGIARGTAKGDVYNLFSVGQFPGQYAAAAAGLTIFKGKEGQAFTNKQGVHILLKSTEKGLKLNVGPEGFAIRMEEAL